MLIFLLVPIVMFSSKSYGKGLSVDLDDKDHRVFDSLFYFPHSDDGPEYGYVNQKNSGGRFNFVPATRELRLDGVKIGTVAVRLAFKSSNGKMDYEYSRGLQLKLAPGVRFRYIKHGEKSEFYLLQGIHTHRNVTEFIFDTPSGTLSINGN